MKVTVRHCQREKNYEPENVIAVLFATRKQTGKCDECKQAMQHAACDKMYKRLGDTRSLEHGQFNR
jgi:hypothetical protein